MYFPNLEISWRGWWRWVGGAWRLPHGGVVKHLALYSKSSLDTLSGFNPLFRSQLKSWGSSHINEHWSSDCNTRWSDKIGYGAVHRRNDYNRVIYPRRVHSSTRDLISWLWCFFLNVRWLPFSRDLGSVYLLTKTGLSGSKSHTFPLFLLLFQ